MDNSVAQVADQVEAGKTNGVQENGVQEHGEGDFGSWIKWARAVSFAACQRVALRHCRGRATAYPAHGQCIGLAVSQKDYHRPKLQLKQERKMRRVTRTPVAIANYTPQSSAHGHRGSWRRLALACAAGCR